MVKTISQQPVLFLLAPEELATTLRMDLNYYHPKFAETMERIEKAAKHYDVKQLEEIADVTRMLGFEEDKLVRYVPKGIPFLQVQNIKDFELDIRQVKYIPVEAHQKLTRSQLRPNDVVVTITGRVGTIAIVPPRTGECNLSKENARIRVRSSNIDPYYVAAYLDVGFGKKLLEKLDSGSTRSRILIKNLRKIPIVVPDVERQTRIVNNVKLLKKRKKEILAETESLLKKSRELLEDSYFHVYEILGIKRQFSKVEKVFVLPKEKLEDRLDATYYSAVSKYDLQSEFPIVTMDKIVEFSRENFSPEREPLGKFKYVQIQDVDPETGQIVSFTELLGKDAPSRARRIIHQGQILTALSGSATGTSSQSTAIVPPEYDGFIASTGFGVLRPRQGIDGLFVYFMLRSSYVLDEIKRRLTGATIPSINESSFQEIALPLPPIHIQCKIADILKRAMEDSISVKAKARTLSEEATELTQEAENEFITSLSTATD